MLALYFQQLQLHLQSSYWCWFVKIGLLKKSILKFCSHIFCKSPTEKSCWPFVKTTRVLLKSESVRIFLHLSVTWNAHAENMIEEINQNKDKHYKTTFHVILLKIACFFQTWDQNLSIFFLCENPSMPTIHMENDAEDVNVPLTLLSIPCHPFN